jgi:hypothetical protein
MGGKALNQFGIFTERKDTKTFLKIGEEIRTILFSDFHLETAIVKCYHEKSDHGDLDLLLKITEDFKLKNINIKDYINQRFKPRGIYYSGGVYSFDYQNFQIDFICIQNIDWDIANTFFNYDCAGNCMGKVYHKFNLSYGWNGLYYKFRNFNGRNSQNILISKDPKKIFEFGCYDYDIHSNGFEKLEDIFKFIISSKYFNSTIFQFNNLRHIDKKRNRKRKTYNLFLSYIADNNIIKSFPFEKNKESYIPMIDAFFPEAKLIEKLNKLKNIDNTNKLLSRKFNGNIIMNWFPELNGKKLGLEIQKFKDNLGSNYDQFILNNNIDLIKEKFTENYKKINNE